MSYETKNIRNVCLLGHGGSGKTTLAESMLYMTGAIDRQGKTADGNTVCDYDPEEIKRQITISTSIAPVNFGGCKINVLDCPGFFDFAGDVMCALRAVEAGMIFCTAKDGIAVGAERSWKYLKNANMPCMFYISKTDEDHGDFAGRPLRPAGEIRQRRLRRDRADERRAPASSTWCTTWLTRLRATRPQRSPSPPPTPTWSSRCARHSLRRPPVRTRSSWRSTLKT